MQHNGHNDCDIEDIIALLYQISDALHICEEASVGGLESAGSACKILSSAQSRALTLLGRVSDQNLHPSNEESADGSKKENLVPNYN